MNKVLQTGDKWQKPITVSRTVPETPSFTVRTEARREEKQQVALKGRHWSASARRNRMLASRLHRAAATLLLSVLLAIWVFIPRLLTAGNFYAGTTSANVPWPGGVVPCEFTNALTAAQQKAYLDGLREWELAANVKFVPHTNQSRWVLFAYSTNSFDNISAGYSPQVVTVNSLSRAQVCHQMGHSFGLTHENIRADQANHLTVMTNNILDSSNNLRWFTIDATSVTNGPYDFESVMHLGWDFLSTQPGVLPTQQPRPAYVPRYNRRMGNLCLSPGDRASLAYLYGPPSVPLTNVVTTSADAGPGSLRAALYYASDHPGSTVRFNIPVTDPGYSNSVFNLHLSGQLPPLVANGVIIDGSTQPGLGSGGQGPTPVDVFVDFESGTNGQIVTPAVLAAGTHGDGTWTTTVALTNMPLHYGSITNVPGLPLPGPVTVGSTIYQGVGGTRSLVMRNEQWEEAVLTYSTTHNKVAVGYWWNPGFGGTYDFNWNDEVAIMSVGWAVDWCINSWEFDGNTSQVVKVHSNAGTGAGINLTGVGTNNTHWYWVSQLYEAGVQASLAIFDTNLNQIGPTSTLPLANLPAKDIEFGQHHAVANHPSISFYNNVVIAYDAKAAFPLIPTSGSTGPTLTGEPLIMVDGSQIPSDPRNAVTGLLIYSAGNQVKNLSFARFNWNGLTLVTADSTNNTISGCWFGLDVTGTNAAPNSYQGILITGGASGNIIGGTNTLARNVLSGNRQYGLWISDSNTAGNVILGNYIGTDTSGQRPVYNWLGGIVVSNAHDNLVGGGAAAAGNVISGNTNAGLWIRGTNSVRNIVQGNLVGLNATGNAALPNTFSGVYLDSGAQSNQVLNNVISANGSYGLYLKDPGTSNNSLLGNIIGSDLTGTNSLGNAFANVGLQAGASGNFVGGTGSGEGNLIAFSGSGPGVVLYDSGTTNNAIRGNVIFSNAGLGIDLKNDGVTLNDTGDSDLGPNQLQNFPVITNAFGSGSSTFIAGRLNGQPNSSFFIDLYRNPTVDPSGYGEGKTFLGTTSVTTDASGNASFVLTNTTGNYAGQYIAATATASWGDTSEFGLAVLTLNKPRPPAGLRIIPSP